MSQRLHGGILTLDTYLLFIWLPYLSVFLSSFLVLLGPLGLWGDSGHNEYGTRFIVDCCLAAFDLKASKRF